MSFSNVYLYCRLTEVGVKVRLEVIEAFPHGFLSMNFMSKDCQTLVEGTLKTIEEFLSDF